MSISQGMFQIEEVLFSGAGGTTPVPFQLRVIDPGKVYQWCIANRIDPSPFWGKANRIMFAYVGHIPQPSYLLVEGLGAKKLSDELTGSGAYKPEAARIEIRIIYQPSDLELSDTQVVVPFTGGKGYYIVADRYVTKCINIAPQSPNEDGPYLLEIHDKTFFRSRHFAGFDTTANDLKTRLYNILVPGTVAYPVDPIGSTTTWTTMHSNAWSDSNTVYSTSHSPPTALPSITEEGMNLVQAGSGLQIMEYIEQLHNVTAGYNIAGNSFVDFNDGLGDETIESLDSVPGRTKYKAASHGNDEYLDYPERFIVLFPNRWAPMSTHNQITSEPETAKSSTVTLPSDSKVPAAAMNDRVIHIHSPVFSEHRPTSPGGSITAENDADMATLADTYRDRLLSRITEANQTIHYIIFGLFLPDISNGTRYLSSRLHEIFVRDYGDGDGMVTELKGGRQVLNRLLGEPFSMLNKPLWAYPGIGMLRDPFKINPVTGAGRVTNPTINSSATATLIYGTGGSESDSAMQASTYYIGATFVGTKRVWVFPNPVSATATGFYSV